MKTSTKWHFETNDPAEALEDLRHRLSALRHAVAALVSNKNRQSEADKEWGSNSLIGALKQLDEIQTHPALHSIDRPAIKTIATTQKVPRTIEHTRMPSSSSASKAAVRDWTIYLIIVAFALGMVASPLVANRVTGGAKTQASISAPATPSR